MGFIEPVETHIIKPEVDRYARLQNEDVNALSQTEIELPLRYSTGMNGRDSQPKDIVLELGRLVSQVTHRLNFRDLSLQVLLFAAWWLRVILIVQKLLGFLNQLLMMFFLHMLPFFSILTAGFDRVCATPEWLFLQWVVLLYLTVFIVAAVSSIEHSSALLQIAEHLILLGGQLRLILQIFGLFHFQIVSQLLNRFFSRSLLLFIVCAQAVHVQERAFDVGSDFFQSLFLLLFFQRFEIRSEWVYLILCLGDILQIGPNITVLFFYFLSTSFILQVLV